MNRFALFLLLVLLIACNSDEATVDELTVQETAVPSATAGPMTITIAGRAGSISDGLASIIPEFEKATGYKVTLLELPYAYLQEKVFTDVITGLGHYDVVFIDDPWLPALAGGGYLVPLEQFGYREDPDFVSRSLDVSRWPPPYGPQPPGDSDDEVPQLYALPLVGNVQMFWYRKDLITQEPQNIQELILMVEETADPDNGLYGYAYRNGWGNPIVTEFMAWNWAYGGDIFDDNWNVIVNNPKSVNALEDFVAFSNTVAPDQGYDRTSSVVSTMLDGTSISAIIWPNQNTLIDDPAQSSVSGNIAVIPFPGGERQTSQLGNWLLGIPTTSPHKQAAFDFLVWATSQESMRAIAETGLPPTRNSLFQDPELIETFWWLPETHEALKNATWRPRMPEWTKVETILGSYLVQVLEGQLEAKPALDQASAEIRALMKQSGYIE